MPLRFTCAGVALLAVVSSAVTQDKKVEGFPGRAEREKLLKQYGGNAESEAAVARGLAWLARMQQKDGPWKFDGSSTDQIAATSMALLPFLAVGQSHTIEDKYQKTVGTGQDWLLKQQDVDDGAFKGASNMYSHALATIALCDAYRISKDVKLRNPATKAVNYILRAQATNGSWGYKAGTEGDTSILGWQIQALAAARLAGIKFDKDKVYPAAEKFLVSVSVDAESKYGYREKGQSQSLTPVGLLSRYHMGWAPDNASLKRGSDWLMNIAPPNKGFFDTYYYYYATQALRTHGGVLWEKKWNPKMRDMLISMQHKGGPPEKLGSWDKDNGFIGASCGRLGTTALAVLTLQVYYRLPPPGVREPDGKDPKK
jgi:hypothetical protein